MYGALRFNGPRGNLMRMRLRSLVLFGAAVCALLATEPNAATRRWWRHVTALANDGMEGRNTGSAAYRLAAEYVAAQFEKAGVKAAGEKGWYQSVPLHEVRLRADQSSATIMGTNGTAQLQFLRQITVGARATLPEHVRGPMFFAGSERGGADLAGKVLVQLPGAGRGAGGGAQGAAAIISIDATTGPEPPRWPAAYSVSMTLRGEPAAAGPQRQGGGAVAFRFNPADAELLFRNSGHTFQELMELQAAGKPLPRFEIPAEFMATLKTESSDLSSDNVIGVLPGSDPALAKEYVVVSAHLDGYGLGEPWNGDRIYNGAFDDAAYVATLIDFAERLHDAGAKPKRSILFCVVTGEEKGLLGSKYFVAHPAVPKESMVADVNLDQLRPIFPLHTLTTLAVDESTLGDTVREVAAKRGIKIQPDPEPQRNLLRRSDHYSFMQIGVPAVGFIFGYVPGTPDEAAYREWYAKRYHSPADDLNQPWVPDAAAKFNDFFHDLVVALADAPERPKWKAGSTFAK